jgi:hypothetical protein
MEPQAMSERDPHQAVDYLIKTAPEYAKAKAERVYIEEFRKSQKALLMQDSQQTSAAMQERDAYADETYQELLKGLRAAVEQEETLRWKLIAAQARVEVWRTEQATARAEGRATQ